MAQTKELEKVKARIRALSEKTMSNGCSEAEAMAAAAKVGELLETYSLSMNEVLVRDEPCILRAIQTGSKRRTHMDHVIPSIAAFCDCRFWTADKRVGREINYFGLEGDVQMALYLHEIVKRAVETEDAAYQRSDAFAAARLATAPRSIKRKAHKRKARPGRSAAYAFRMGMVDRIGARLRDMKRQREEALAAALSTTSVPVPESGPRAPSGTALVVVKKQVIEEAMKRQLPDLRLKTTHFSRTSIRSGAAYSAGREAGERVTLNRPITGSPVGAIR